MKKKLSNRFSSSFGVCYLFVLQTLSITVAVYSTSYVTSVSHLSLQIQGQQPYTSLKLCPLNALSRTVFKTHWSDWTGLEARVTAPLL